MIQPRDIFLLGFVEYPSLEIEDRQVTWRIELLLPFNHESSKIVEEPRRGCNTNAYQEGLDQQPALSQKHHGWPSPKLDQVFVV